METTGKIKEALSNFVAQEPQGAKLIIITSQMSYKLEDELGLVWFPSKKMYFAGVRIVRSEDLGRDEVIIY